MQVAQLWRYPVKSMAGEQLASLQVTAHGVAGDREYAFESQSAPPGMLRVSGRERQKLLGFQASGLGDAVAVRSSGEQRFSVSDPALLQALQLADGRLVRSARPQTDCRPLALISLASIAAIAREFGRQLDPRQFRANFYLDGLAPWEEEAWVGRPLRLGSALLQVTERDPRCRFFSLHPATGEAMPALMKWLARDREGRAGIYAKVLQPGQVTAGDEVTLEP